jgi:hypothetical protein
MVMRETPDEGAQHAIVDAIARLAASVRPATADTSLTTTMTDADETLAVLLPLLVSSRAGRDAARSHSRRL